MRKAMTILSVLALGAAVTARAEEKKDDRESRVARAMAVAEIDFELHRAQLGLIGSSLLSEGHAKPDAARPTSAAKPKADVTTAPVEAPVAPAAISDPRS